MELFALIKKLCVNGTQKPTTEFQFQFHFMFIFLLWEKEQKSYLKTNRNSNQRTEQKSTERTMNNVVCIRWMSYVYTTVT